MKEHTNYGVYGYNKETDEWEFQCEYNSQYRALQKARELWKENIPSKVTKVVFSSEIIGEYGEVE